jgi:hypothetical protein
MTRSSALRRRLAVGLAGALLGAALIGGVAEVSADTDVNPASDRDRPVDQQTTDTSAFTITTVVQSQSAPIVSDQSAMGPDQGVNQAQTRDDRDSDEASN